AEKARSLAEEAAALAGDVSRRYADAAEEDPAETLDRIQGRLDKLFRLKQKYGGTEESVLAAYEKAVAGRERLEARAGEVARLETEKKKLVKQLKETGALLRNARLAVAKELETGVRELLAFLDMPGTAVRVSLEELPDPGPRGLDKAAFLLAANAGEGEKPLAKIASGGELSRIMLALQLKLGKAKTADTVVFDEIDTGISGATAQKIGLCLKALGESRQVICVTHSAQVATLADHHDKVEKTEADGRTETTVRALDSEASLEEVARILGGKTLGSATRENALALREEGLREYDLNKVRIE
ncbi:MAG: DNA repair protein RecN, partial [Clostridia bacterium]|nr:DNA repair protein RecN [Clostridia bacterium]